MASGGMGANAGTGVVSGLAWGLSAGTEVTGSVAGRDGEEAARLT